MEVLLLTLRHKSHHPLASVPGLRFRRRLPPKHKEQAGWPASEVELCLRQPTQFLVWFLFWVVDLRASKLLPLLLHVFSRVLRQATLAPRHHLQLLPPMSGAREQQPRGLLPVPALRELLLYPLPVRRAKRQFQHGERPQVPAWRCKSVVSQNQQRLQQ